MKKISTDTIPMIPFLRIDFRSQYLTHLSRCCIRALLIWNLEKIGVSVEKIWKNWCQRGIYEE